MDNPTSAFAVYYKQSENQPKKKPTHVKKKKKVPKTRDVSTKKPKRLVPLVLGRADSTKKKIIKKPTQATASFKYSYDDQVSPSQKHKHPTQATVSLKFSTDDQVSSSQKLTTPNHQNNIKRKILKEHPRKVVKNAPKLRNVYSDSKIQGKEMFVWLIKPISFDKFFETLWEKQPLHLARKQQDYYQNIISTPMIDNMLRNENILFGKNIDVTSYVNGKRETHNPIGRAHPHVVWDYYLNGCSIRLLNPQTYIPPLHLLNATLQEYFNSFVGANVYLTPPDSQGFAPHYDDIEAFVMQIEGKKHWKVYKPLSSEEVLPRKSSRNFDESEIGSPIMEVTLEPGDLLYLPRGFIHQAVTIDGHHSLHITVSFYQKHSWADLFEKLIPKALETAINNDVEFRKGLPLDIYENLGVVHSHDACNRRKVISSQINKLFSSIMDHLPIDHAVDELNKNFQHDALPPVLNSTHKVLTVFGDSDVMLENGIVTKRVEFNLDTKIRLLTKNILRMVLEEGDIRLYYHIENSLEYHGNEPQFVEILEELAPAVETLIKSYPKYVAVEDLPAKDDTDKIQLASDLWEKGLLMTNEPLETIED